MKNKIIASIDLVLGLISLYWFPASLEAFGEPPAHILLGSIYLILGIVSLLMISSSIYRLVSIKKLFPRWFDILIRFFVVIPVIVLLCIIISFEYKLYRTFGYHQPSSFSSKK
ncbi:MAG: hypothetical protein ABI597_09960 [Gammaproteobacteria bacterium]